MRSLHDRPSLDRYLALSRKCRIGRSGDPIHALAKHPICVLGDRTLSSWLSISEHTAIDGSRFRCEQERWYSIQPILEFLFASYLVPWPTLN